MESDFTGTEVEGEAKRNMDKKAPSKNTVFSRLNTDKCEHLKPLSVYSRMITCDQKSSLHHVRKFPDPFVNFKIEVVNNCAKKRKLDDSSPESSCETPAKKSYSPNALSPDLGCFMDYCSPSPVRQDSVSPLAISQSALLDKTQSIKSESKETLSSQLNSERVACGSTTEPGGDEGTLTRILKCEGVLLNLGPAFDFDVDDIMCLSPLGTSSARGLLDCSESGKNPSSNTVSDGQEMGRGDGHLVEGQDKSEKDSHLNVQVEEDKGYFSMSYLKDCKRVSTQLSPPTSSPVLRLGEVKAAEDVCRPESSSVLVSSASHAQAVMHSPRVSFTASSLCPTVSGLLSKPVISPVEALEGDIEEAWTIGLPLFESSVCHNVTVKLNAGSEQSRQVSEEVQGGVIEPLHKCQTTLVGEETTLDTSYETTLPLQVQVKSVVVALNQLSSSSKPVASPLPDQNTRPARSSPNKNRVSQTAKCNARSLRPVIFKREADWEHEKSLYVSSVTRHMNERSSGAPDVMTELLKLMTDVADQTPGTAGKQWQHPSDLTRRNYQRRFGNMVPKMSLHEWQAKSCPTHKRFSKVPKIFERSPFP